MEKEAKAAKTQGVKPAKEATVHEIGKNLPAVMARSLGLPQTIEAVEQLHKKIIHRNRLEYYIDHLATFEIKRDEEELKDGYYAGCRLEIKDDGNNVFHLKHPHVIKEVIDFMKKRFGARLAEIESEIVLPKVA